MVIATPKDQQVVRQTVEQMLKDAVPPEKPVLRLYSLPLPQRSRFTAIQADLMQQFPGMRVIEDPETGELAIWARASHHDQLKEVFERLKASGDGAEQRFVITYPVRRGSAKAVFDMLKELYPTARLFLDDRADLVTVEAPLSLHARIKQTVAQRDVEPSPDSEEELRSYTVGDANPTLLTPILQALVSKMRLTADPPTNKIIAFGTARDHATLEKAIAQFRTGDPSQRPTVRVYSIEGRDATALAQVRSVLLQVAPDAAIAVDPQGGAIVVSATNPIRWRFARRSVSGWKWIGSPRNGWRSIPWSGSSRLRSSRRCSGSLPRRGSPSVPSLIRSSSGPVTRTTSGSRRRWRSWRSRPERRPAANCAAIASGKSRPPKSPR